ncbi:MAG: hypothetical protein K6E56_07095 [Lachnospiraceae bacterium]|nr:hypothetical protein [Lachnospiraceae bacterium]
MLKIKAPIRPILSTPIQTVGDGFSNRIAGNYELFDLAVTGEDFLHLLSAPPEVFLMEEGGNVNFSSNTNIREVNQKKIEIINNFLNRVALSESVNLTYQDRVFITDVLHKLGITEVSSFMKRVENIKNEQRDFSERLNAYWNYSEEMKSLVEEYITSEESTVNTYPSSNEEILNSLHQDIFKRLHTGEVYQILSNFYEEERGADEITSREIVLSEQKETAEKLLLQALINEVRGEELPLIYRQDNFYETEAALPGESEEEAKKAVTSAALLSVIRSAAVSRREENINNRNNWYEIAGNLYRSEENTFQRITENLHRNMTLIENGVTDITDIINFGLKTYENFTSEADIDYTTENLIHNVTETEGDEYLDISETDNRRYDLRTDIEKSEDTEVLNTNTISSDTSVLLTDIEKRTENILSYVTNEGASNAYETSENEVNMAFSETDITNVNREEITENIENVNDIEAPVNRQEVNLLRQQLTQNIEENNSRMRATYEAHLQALTNNYHSMMPKKTKAEVEAAQKKALKNPAEFLKEYREEKRAEEERRKEFDRQRSELVLTQSPDAFTVIQQFLEHPEIIPEGVTITRNDIGSLLYDSRQVENSYREIERKLNIKEEDVKSLEEKEFERSKLLNVTDSKAKDITENEITKAAIEHLNENRIYQNELYETVENVTEGENVTRNTVEKELEKSRINKTLERQSDRIDSKTVENIKLIHKLQETGIDEELLEEIRRNRVTQKDVTEHHTVEEHHITDEKTINTVVDQRLREQERRIEDLVSEGMTRQMNSISDRVLRQLEKRLANERSRRGV